MKNIHVLPTEKPSRLHEYDFLSPMGISKEPLQWRLGRNIYITSDEKPKAGDWCYVFRGDTHRLEKAIHNDLQTWRKIILTTDQNLIKDGIQAIDDDFLEYFLGVPFGEIKEVEVEWVKTPDGIFYHQDNVPYGCYKIIIPKEELEMLEVLMPIYKQERRYSDEDMKSAFKIGFNIGYGSPVSELDLKQKHCDKWFEQFKKK